MQNIRKRVEALERDLPMKQGSPVWVFGRDAVTGRWVCQNGDGVERAGGVVLMFSDAPPDPELVTDAPARVIDPSWERR
jgi:hypothetical protein